ncbi:hypothetical protein [Paenibacillus sp. A14]|uniref:hypothetical protein n=1 Tax=Paenibacillus sp. A14 TaxID=3119820 RepID=UPI002FDFD7AF
MKYKFICGWVLLILLVACNANPNNANTVEPIEPSKIDLQNYEGSWTDKDFNQFTCSDCLNSAEIDVSQNNGDLGSISIFLYNPYRLTDSTSDFQLEGNKASFIFDDSVGKGRGTLTFLKDEIHIRLDLEQASDEMSEIYHKERILVRDPYKGLKRFDPLELLRNYLHLKDVNNLEINSGAEWNEELDAGPEVEVVNRKDESGNVVQMYRVNTLNQKIEELEL